jgi:hypothetical protein
MITRYHGEQLDYSYKVFDKMGRSNVFSRVVRRPR